MAPSAAQRLRALLAEPGLLVVPGAFDALAARLIEAAGFRAVYATGAGIANAYLGWADVGLTTMTEVRDAVWRIVDATALPVLADIDTGFGNAVNVARTVREFERIGVAAVQLEDQVFPKRCGHFAGKAVISQAEMVGKLRAACEARQDGLVIIARTDARAVEGLEAAIARARAYRAAGADVLFVEAPRSRAELATIAAALGDAPLLVNLVEGGQTPILPAAELAALGYKLALYANTALRAAARGMQRALAYLAAHGSTLGAEDLLIDWETRQRLVRLPEIEALERRYASPG
ncbi:MAG TPA: oxaloacetate decarboxylase [Chloroflexota bacterium]|jgi:2-methylisocitrate lyase-like PEP mutase family enzyme|nr:oxaloacetate decarboxylase [Chloroflexota bacterium]